jgi:phosphomannomutase
MSRRREAEEWLEQDPDPETRAELWALLEDERALDELFGARLEFGTAGLRGELGAGPGRMNRVTVMRAAAGIAAVLGSGASVVIGFDARRKSDVFAEDSAAVLAGAGLRVQVLPRPLPTPVLAYAVRHLGADAGIMVTASHNPPRDNGYKVYWADGAQIIPPLDAEIFRAIEAVGRVDELPRDTGWEPLGEEIVEAYLRSLARLPLGCSRELTVAYTPLHGVGGEVLRRAFEWTGFPAPDVVAEQAEPDPAFPTVPFPNPEEPGALDLALALGKDHDLVIANDPDADRCAVAVGGRPLTGDEVGGLLGEYVLRHTGGADRLVVTTIVSSSLLGKIAAAHGVRYAESLTGFKWIMKAGTDRDRFVYGYEEALGYCVGGEDGVPTRDKDGIGAALTVAALAADAKAAGRTLPDLLDDQARRYGLHLTAQHSVRVADPARMAAAMANLRAEPPAAFGGRAVIEACDLAAGVGGLPKADVLRYRLSGDARVIVRPSGTEPKLKCYLEIVLPVTGPVEEARAAGEAELAALRDDVSKVLRL